MNVFRSRRRAARFAFLILLARRRLSRLRLQLPPSEFEGECNPPCKIKIGHRMLVGLSFVLDCRLSNELPLDRLYRFEDSALGGPLPLAARATWFRNTTWIAGMMRTFSPSRTEIGR
jgi:hypothetical protein